MVDLTPEELDAHYADEKSIHPKTRAAVLERDNYRCRKCGNEELESLTIHHVVYRSHGGNHAIENLITLCAKCHLFRLHGGEIYVVRRNGDWFFHDVIRYRVINTYLNRRRDRDPRPSKRNKYLQLRRSR